SFDYVLRKIKRPPAIRQIVGILFLILLAVLGKPSGAGTVLLGSLLTIPGLAIRAWAGGYVKKDKELATTGPYSYVRNPLYVGNVLIAIGFCVLSGFWWSYLVFALLYVWLYIPSIQREERTLQKLFGDAFLRYKENVRAMWPRLLPYQPGSDGWSAAQWVKNGEHIVNGGIVIAYLVLCFR
ncbi:MAG: isoprenylcysteine carboxylmethyltransferase family protein, partial [bacterium]|nr:isoprenylcysteine carboxylmethyltransferase family protein [bacterium]